MLTHCKLFVIMIIFVLLNACGNNETTPTSTAPTVTSSPIVTPQAAEQTAVPLTASPSSQTAAPTHPPIIDGIFSLNEWAAAEIAVLSDGSELFTMQDEDYLYLGIRSVTPEMIGANVFVAEGGQVRILHTSAALGTAVYQLNSDIWQQTKDFDWQCRETSNSESAQAERAAYLQQNQWLAANSRMGVPNELEYQIEITDPSQRLAVSVFRSSTPNKRTFWPPTLNDDTIQPYPGGLPKELHFSPDQWAADVMQ